MWDGPWDEETSRGRLRQTFANLGRIFLRMQLEEENRCPHFAPTKPMKSTIRPSAASKPRTTGKIHRSVVWVGVGME